MAELVDPKTITLKDGDKESKFIISKMDCWDAREVFVKYPQSVLPKHGEYEVNKAMVQIMMNHVCAFNAEGQEVRLVTHDLVRNHVPSFGILAKLEKAMGDYNYDFFHDGTLQSIFLTICDRVSQTFLTKILEILTPSSEPLSDPNSPPSMNSEQSIP